MSSQSAPPSLEQYPGYFPAAKPPFWTRTKVGIACGVLGLVLGAAVASGDSGERDRAQRASAADVEKAVAAEKSRQAASQTAPEVNTFAGSPRNLDPRFSYCYEANDAGYGPYLRGIDPEYDWYDDRDNDGLVCES